MTRTSPRAAGARRFRQRGGRRIAAGVAASLLAVAPAAVHVVGSLGSASAAAGSVGGFVFRDANFDGVKDVGEESFAGLWVKVFSQEPGVDGIAGTGDDTEGAHWYGTTHADGSWGFGGITSAADKVRVEFLGVDLDNDAVLDPGEESLPNWLAPTTDIAGNGSTVRHVALDMSGSNPVVNLGVTSPTDYCQANPSVVTSCFTLGSNGANGQLRKVASDLSAEQGTLATTGSVGAVNGLAYRGDDNVFSASYVKRHTEYGNGTTPTIYRTTQSGTTSVFATLSGTLPSHDSGDYLTDAAVSTAVGAAGLGDLDVAEDGSRLYTVDMASKALVSVGINGWGDAVTTGSVSAVGIPVPAGCAVADWRPMGLAAQGGLVYVGGVCSAESTQSASDLEGVVLVYNPGTTAVMLGAQTIAAGSFGSSPTFTFDLGYPRKDTWCDDFATCPNNGDAMWQPWTSSVVHSPMLADLDFWKGNLVIGLRDRLGDQTRSDIDTNGAVVSPNANGDVLLACAATPGSWVLESNGACGSLTGANPGSGEGPGGGEYIDDNLRWGSSGHPDIATGGLAVVGNNLIHAVWDPQDGAPGVWAYRSGLEAKNLSGGTRAGRLALTPVQTDPAAANYFGKVNGMGDVEALCGAAPLEIGDRIWRDVNGDGIQSPAEPGIANVTVELHNGAGTVVDTKTTDANGNYRFAGVDKSAPYTITVGTTQAVLSGLSLTTADQADEYNGDNSDSDATLTGNTAVISLTTGLAGQNDLTFDLGFVPYFQIGNRVWEDTDNDSVLDDGETGLAGATAELLDSAGNAVLDSGANPRTAPTDADGYYLFDKVLAGSYRVRVTGPAGYVSSTIDDATAGADANGAVASDSGVGTAAIATSPVFTIGPSANAPTGETGVASGTNVPDTMADLTIDFGFHRAMDLDIDLSTAAPSTVDPGDAVDWNIAVSNNGPSSAAAGYTVTVSLPTGLSLAAIPFEHTTDWSMAQSGSTLTFTSLSGVLASGANAPQIVLHTIVGTGASGALKVQTYVSPVTGDIVETIPAASFDDGSPSTLSNNDDAHTLNVTAPTTTTVPATTTTEPPTTTTEPPTTTTEPPTTTTEPATTTVPPATTTVPPATTTVPPTTTTVPPTTTVPASTSTVPASTSTVPASTSTVPSSTTPPDTTPASSTTAPTTTAPTTTAPTTTSTTAPTTTAPASTTTTSLVVTVVTVIPASTTTTTTAPTTTTTSTQPVLSSTTTAPPTTVIPSTTAPATTQPFGSICSVVWRDDNNDGRPDAVEPAINGAVVLLVLPNGETRRTVTNASGTYCFDGLPGGTYKVEISSTTDPSNGPRARTVTVQGAQITNDADFGFTMTNVAGIELEHATGPLAFTGANSLLAAAVALMLLGLGGMILSKRRREGRHYTR